MGIALSVGVVWSAAALASGEAHAEETTQLTGVPAEEEAWFYRFTRPTDAAGDPEDPGTGHVDFVKTNSEIAPPYDGGTLRVGLVNGQPEARTFLALPSLFEFGPAAQVAGGHVTFPLHPEDDSLREPQRADMVACLVTEVIAGEEGARWSDQPMFDCEVQAPLELDEGTDPLTWTLDVGLFAAAWQDGAVPHGLVILENPKPAEEDPSWHVAFRSKNHPDGPAITYDLLLRGADPAIAGITVGGSAAVGGSTGGARDTSVFPGSPTLSSGYGEDANDQPQITPPIGAVPRSDAIPLGRSTELLIAVVVALGFGVAAFQTLNQGARFGAAGAAGSPDAGVEP